MKTMSDLSCSNCEWTGPDEDAVQASDISERHETGVVYSDKECPECGCLCYPEDPTENYPWWDIDEGRKLLIELKEHPDFSERVSNIRGL